jgi:hypothetical protein
MEDEDFLRFDSIDDLSKPTKFRTTSYVSADEDAGSGIPQEMSM